MTAVHSSHAHRRNDSGISVHSIGNPNGPPSPTFTNPDLILPHSPWQHEPSLLDPSSTHEPDLTLTPTISATSSQRNSGGTTELGVATAVFMPTARVVVRPPAPVNRPTTPTNGLYSGYEHGAPLSDIYEESEATPRSTKFGRRTPSPSPLLLQSIEKPPSPSTRDSGPVLRHKKRLSSMSTSSAGSDVEDWENFDSSRGMSDRVAADIARMKREDSGDNEETTSRRQSKEDKRQSKEEEELAALNARAERILENARKRLTHMEDNLKSARTSVLMPSRSSPHLGEHQPVGGLYRSISAAGATRLNKSKPLFPPLRNPQLLHHNRGISDVSSNKMPKVPEVRSASALEYQTPFLFTTSPDTKDSASQAKFQPSPTTSSRSFNSPLRPLEEEDKGQPSTAETTPEVIKVGPPRGLGIHKSASISRENLNEPFERPSSRTTPTPTHLNRSSSSASTRSAKELREQMSDLKNRIADLKFQAQADNLRRRSLQSLRTPSPFGSGQPDQWYTSSSSNNKDSSVNTNAGVGWKKQSSKIHNKSQSLDGPVNAKNQYSTPQNQRFLDVLGPDADSALQSSARTDRNTPSLSRPRHLENDSIVGELDEQDAESIAQLSQEEEDRGAKERQNNEYADDEQIAENEEEQIYLNEVLEESLRDAEVEPEVPMIPAAYLNDTELLSGSEAERHEDRLDAFDYENMFLHSAMGTYTGKSLNGSDSGSESDDSEGSGPDNEVNDDEDNESVETSREGNKTPTPNFHVDDGEDQDSEHSTDEEMEEIIAGRKSPGFSIKGTPNPDRVKPSQRQLKSPPRMNLPTPPKKPWLKTRSDSMDSTSTAATFQTATEGEDGSDEDKQPEEILNWSPAQPETTQYHGKGRYQYPNPSVSPRQQIAMHNRYPSSSINSGRDTPSSVSTITQSRGIPSAAQHSRQSTLSGDYASFGGQNMNGIGNLGPGLGLGVIGAENAQYINDNGVPERFQGQPSPKRSNIPRHSPSQSQSSTISHAKKASTMSATTGHSRNYSAGQAITPVMPTPPSPQRKIVVNQSFRGPVPDNMGPTQTGRALQAVQHSPVQSRGSTSSKGTPTSQQNAFRSQSQQSNQHSRVHSQKSAPSPLGPAAPVRSAQQSPQTPLPNTEILMESLIKLADPTFALSEGTRFADIDKELVLGLLRAVGGVCDGVLRAERDVRERRTGYEAVREYRGRLEGARGVLEGRWKVNGQRVVEGIAGDEDDEMGDGGMF